MSNRLMELESSLVRDRQKAKKRHAKALSTRRQPQRAGRSFSIPVDYSVPGLVPVLKQPDGMSCWATVTAMLYSWRDGTSRRLSDVIGSIGKRWLKVLRGKKGLMPKDHGPFLTDAGLVSKAPQSFTVEGWHELLRAYGPLWVTMDEKAGPKWARHARVLIGIHGDGTPKGTELDVIDPSGGRSYREKVSDFMPKLEEEIARSGRWRPQVIHFPQEVAEKVRRELNQSTTPASAPPVVLAKGAPQSEDDLDDRDWYTDDVLRQSGRTTEARSLAVTRKDAKWAQDAVSPDYRHLGEAGRSQAFTLTAAHFEDLVRRNHFQVEDGEDEVLFGLRGCHLLQGSATQLVASVELSEDTPDHYGAHCVLGVWKRSTKKVAVFSGSTVPNWFHMNRQKNKGGQRANLLLTGRYIYTVGKHRAVNGAFIQQANVIVLRSNDDLVYETSDDFERHSPADNIHPGFSPWHSKFSSAGCQTVPGDWSVQGGHTGTWADFRQAAGLSSANNSKWGQKLVYVLLTGREARLAATQNDTSALTRLRFGSQGPGVRALQQALTKAGLYSGKLDGDMGQGTTWAWIRWQQQNRSNHADGIVTPSLGLQLGFDLIRKQSVPATPVAQSMVRAAPWSAALGSPADGSPLVAHALPEVLKKLHQLRKNAADAGNPNVISAQTTNKETGIRVDANPYVGITDMELEAVVRAGYTSHQMPEVLLALWAKEGSTRSVTSWRVMTGATTADNARIMLRNSIYYVDLGIDHFMVTTQGKTDNLLNNSDAAAAGHEAYFKSRVQELVKENLLSRDISGDINAEIKTRKNADGSFSAKPTVAFYTLSLLLADAYFTQLQRKTFSELPIVSSAMNYFQWNLGTTKFKTFLTSAEGHRKEPAHQRQGQPISIEEWALRTKPKSNEWAQPRRNVVRFRHYIDSFKPLFAQWMNVIKPGVEDLPTRA